MGQKDLTEKNLEYYPDVFADIFNALLYHGQQVVSEAELQPAPTETLYPDSNSRLHNQFHDVSKYVIQDGCIKMQYTLENESQAKRKTVLRKAGYEGAIYREQLDKTDSYPVISSILYWGKARWQQPRSLSQLWKRQQIPDVAKEYIELVHVEALLRMLKALTGDERYEFIVQNMQNDTEKEGEVTMCELLDKYENRGIARGRAEDISNLMETMKWTAEQAMSALKIPENERDQYLARL